MDFVLKQASNRKQSKGPQYNVKGSMVVQPWSLDDFSTRTMEKIK